MKIRPSDLLSCRVSGALCGFGNFGLGSFDFVRGIFLVQQRGTFAFGLNGFVLEVDVLDVPTLGFDCWGLFRAAICEI